MGTAIKHPVPDRVKPSFVIFDIWALWCQKLLMTAYPVWHRMLYNGCTYMATVGVKGLISTSFSKFFSKLCVKWEGLTSLPLVLLQVGGARRSIVQSVGVFTTQPWRRIIWGQRSFVSHRLLQWHHQHEVCYVCHFTVMYCLSVLADEFVGPFSSFCHIYSILYRVWQDKVASESFSLLSQQLFGILIWNFTDLFSEMFYILQLTEMWFCWKTMKLQTF